MPSSGEDLPLSWRRIKHQDFEDIQWTYTEAPRLVCNGIKIEGQYGFTYSDKVWPSGLNRPSVSVFDPDGKLPLDLRRVELVDGAPFVEDLAQDVARDLVAFLLVNAPEVNFWENRPDWLALGKHPSVAREEHPFFYSVNGFGLTANFSPADRFMILGLVGGEPPILKKSTPFKNFFLFKTHYLSQDSLSWVVKEFLEIDRRSSSSFGGFIRSENARRIIISRYWAARFSKGPAHVRIPRYKMELVEEETQVNGWVVWKMGKCPSLSEELLAALKMSKGGEVDGKRGEAFFGVEIYPATPPTPRDSTLSRVWREVVQSDEIPYARRRSVLKLAFKNLGEYIERYEKLGSEWKQWKKKK